AAGATDLEYVTRRQRRESIRVELDQATTQATSERTGCAARDAGLRVLIRRVGVGVIRPYRFAGRSRVGTRKTAAATPHDRESAANSADSIARSHDRLV